MTRNTVIGVFDSQRAAQDVAEQLQRQGFSGDDIHVSNREHEHHHGFIHWLEDLFSTGPKDDGTTYRTALDEGRSVVAVDADETRLHQAAQLMEQHGAREVSGSAEGNGVENRDLETSGAEGRRSQSNGVAEQSIPVIEQKLDVQKKTVLQGGVRVFSRVSEQPIQEEIRLRQEKVKVERRPADRPVTAAEEGALRDQTIEMTETREEPVVRKISRVVEEVVVGKETTERVETIRDNVRRTDVSVEPLQSQPTPPSGGTSQMPAIPADTALDFKTDFQNRYAVNGGRYEDYEGAYDYGYRSAGDYKGQRFEDLEEKLRTDYLRNNPNSNWDQIRGAARYGWERLTGKR